jgi:hypothetical protein
LGQVRDIYLPIALSKNRIRLKINDWVLLIGGHNIAVDMDGVVEDEVVVVVVFNQVNDIKFDVAERVEGVNNSMETIAYCLIIVLKA